jgi:acetyl-CoA decarbonylase/synthase complex subunit delta
MEPVKEKYVGAISTIEIGKSGPGTVKAGGGTCMPFLFEEGVMPNPPVVAMEIFDCEPVDWPDNLKTALGKVATNPVSWAKFAVDECGCKIICVRMQGAHPDWKNTTSEEAVSILKKISKAVNVPLVVMGSGDDLKDSDLMPKVSQALKGQRALLGSAVQNNYKTITATALADGHSIIAESPIDINIAKQLNILITDMGMDACRIVMHPTTASLGYGMEYTYSIMERSRIAAFTGDKMLAMPFVLFPGAESWRVKEAKEASEIGGKNWELVTSVAMLQAGADILVMRDPNAIRETMKYIKDMISGGSK